MNCWVTESSLREPRLKENWNLVSESLGNRIITGKQDLRESGNPVGERPRENRSPEGEGSMVNWSLIKVTHWENGSLEGA